MEAKGHGKNVLLDPKHDTGLADFLDRVGVDVQWYQEQLEAGLKLPRHVRVNPYPVQLWDPKNRNLSRDSLMKLVQENMASTITSITGLNGSPVRWLSALHQNSANVPDCSVWALPGNTSLASTDLYQSGAVFGLDAASIYAIVELGATPGDRVIDLCCAPGAKLCVLSDIMKRQGTLVGLDVSMKRLYSCVGMVRKYRASSPLPPNYRSESETSATNSTTTTKDPKLTKHEVDNIPDWEFHVLCTDSTKIAKVNTDEIVPVWDWVADRTFFYDNIEFVSNKEQAEYVERGAKRTRLNKSMKQRILRDREEILSGKLGYTELLKAGTFDRVLVDAECTHDGSLKHMEKYNNIDCGGESATSGGPTWGVEELKQKFIEAKRSDESLKTLQCSLLENGLHLLRPGGTLVYSTCSFSRQQNEDVVREVLKQVPNAKVVSLAHFDKISDIVTLGEPIDKETEATGVYFSATKSETSGLFVCKITTTGSGSNFD